MKTSLFSALVVLATLVSATQAEDRTVIVIVKGSKANCKVGDVIRVVGNIASGQGDITATVKGSGKLIASNALMEQSDGQFMVGSFVREFEVRAEKAGVFTITVTTDNKIFKEKKETVYTITAK